jgi:hypothetical protein
MSFLKKLRAGALPRHLSEVEVLQCFDYINEIKLESRKKTNIGTKVQQRRHRP